MESLFELVFVVWMKHHQKLLDHRTQISKPCKGTQLQSLAFSCYFHFECLHINVPFHFLILPVATFRFQMLQTVYPCSTWASFIHVNYLPCLYKKEGEAKKVWTLLSENMKVNREKSTGWGIFVFPSLLRQWRHVEAQNLCCFETLFLPPLPTPPPPFSQSVFCYKGSKSSGIRPEPRLESLNPDALQSRERAIHLLIWDSKQAFCSEEREGEREEGGKKKRCRVIFRLNVPLHNNLHKQPCVCDKKIGNFQRLCGDWELKAFLRYLPSCSWPPQIPQLLSRVSSQTTPYKLSLLSSPLCSLWQCRGTPPSIYTVFPPSLSLPQVYGLSLLFFFIPPSHLPWPCCYLRKTRK